MQRVVLLLVFLSLAGALYPKISAAAPSNITVTQWLVRLKPRAVWQGPDTIRVLPTYPGWHEAGWLLIEAPITQAPLLQATSFYPNPLLSLTDVITPNDTHWSQQYGPSAIGAPQAWLVTTGTLSVTIAIIDTGVDFTHPDLAAQQWTNPDETMNGLDDDNNGYIDDVHGWNYISDTATVESKWVGGENPTDDNGHGTHVAGIAAAVGNNALGIAGISWRSRVMALKIMDWTGSGTESDLFSAIHYAVDEGAQVINVSITGACYSGFSLMQDAVQYAYQHNVTVVGAAGNSLNPNNMAVACPAAYPEVIAVAAVDANNQRATFSRYGSAIDVAAPGVNIYATVPTSNCQRCDISGFKTISGTSMAAPHVTGAVALLLTQPQFNTPDKIRAALEATTLDIQPWICRDIFTGAGLIQIDRALQYDPENSLPSSCHYFYFPVIGR